MTKCHFIALSLLAASLAFIGYKFPGVLAIVFGY